MVSRVDRCELASPAHLRLNVGRYRIPSLHLGIRILQPDIAALASLFSRPCLAPDPTGPRCRLRNLPE